VSECELPVSARGRAWIGRVDGPGDAALKAALRDGLGFVRGALRGGWTVLPDGSALPEDLAPGLRVGRDIVESLFALGPAASYELSGRVAGLEAVRLDEGVRVAVRPSRSARLYRYQLSVAEGQKADPLWDRLAAPAELYHADHVAAIVRLRGLPDGEPFHGALRLLGRSVPAPSAGAGVVGVPGADPRRLVEPLEIADPDLVVVDARQLGWGGDEITQPVWPLGAVIVADSACAADLACCALLGVDPASVPALQMAAARGFGPGRFDELDLGGEDPAEFARRVQGFGATPPGLRGLLPWAEERLGHPLPITIAVGEGSGEAEAVVARSLLRWLDVPSARHRMADWGDIAVVVGEPAELPKSRHLILAGDAACARFSRSGVEATTWFRLPPVSQAFPRAVRRFSDGSGARWVWEVPGAAPRTDALELALWLASRGRMRSPLLIQWFGVRRRLWRWLAGLQRARRNRAGVPVVHARKIARLRERSWRLSLPENPRLARRDPLALPSGD
jgi:hypothetical protein